MTTAANALPTQDFGLRTVFVARRLRMKPGTSRSVKCAELTLPTKTENLYVSRSDVIDCYRENGNR